MTISYFLFCLDVGLDLELLLSQSERPLRNILQKKPLHAQKEKRSMKRRFPPVIVSI